MPKIEYLNLDNTRIDDEALKSVAAMAILHAHYLNETPITDKGLAHLHSAKTLHRLELRQTEVTEKGVAALKKAVPEIQVLFDE